MPQICISPFQIKIQRAENTAKRSKRAKHRLARKTKEGLWSHLKGQQLSVHGNSKAPPYPADANVGKEAEGMDKIMWLSRVNSKGIAHWIRIRE